jgi:hypothetical protein
MIKTIALSIIIGLSSMGCATMGNFSPYDEILLWARHNKTTINNVVFCWKSHIKPKTVSCFVEMGQDVNHLALIDLQEEM